MSSVSGSGELNWGNINSAGPRTTRTATFNAGGQSYTLTVGYNKQAIMDKYSVSETGVDAKMQEIIGRMSTDTLKSLAGYTVNTSLENLESNTTYQSLSGGDSGSYASLQSSNPELYNTIHSVMDVFKNSLSSLSTVPTTTGQQVSIGVSFEEVSDDNDELSSVSGTEIRFERVDLNPKDSLVAELPKNHPLKDDDDFLSAVVKYNDGVTDNETADAIVYKIDTLGTPDQKNAAMLLIKDVFNRDDLREEIGLLDEEDTVCDFSQGRMGGKLACASICGQAILHLADEQPIDSQSIMHKIMKVGITKHGAAKEVNFDTVVMPRLEDNFKIEVVAENYLEKALEKGAYCVLTYQKAGGNETVLVHFDKEKKPVLFNSHGSQYKGAARGASNRKFESLDKLKAHLESIYGKNPQVTPDLVTKKV